ncbi:hypothetical protein TNCV_1764791 [Trichonephila clavipes]|nr:hypothetical protein TNCV_1764791 [Trichonephila clavipes]
MNSSQHGCTNQASASKSPDAAYYSLNSSVGTLFGSPWFILVVSCSTVVSSICPNTISATVVRLCHLWPVVHHICHVADFEQSHFAMHGTLLPRGHANTFTNSAVSEMLPPLARKPVIMPFWTSDKSLRFCITLTIEMFFPALIPLYIRSTALCRHLPSVIGYLTLKWTGTWWSHCVTGLCIISV